MRQVYGPFLRISEVQRFNLLLSIRVRSLRNELYACCVWYGRHSLTCSCFLQRRTMPPIFYSWRPSFLQFLQRTGMNVAAAHLGNDRALSLTFVYRSKRAIHKCMRLIWYQLCVEGTISKMRLCIGKYLLPRDPIQALISPVAISIVLVTI